MPGNATGRSLEWPLCRGSRIALQLASPVLSPSCATSTEPCFTVNSVQDRNLHIGLPTVQEKNVKRTDFCTARNTRFPARWWKTCLRESRIANCEKQHSAASGSGRSRALTSDRSKRNENLGDSYVQPAERIRRPLAIARAAGVLSRACTLSCTFSFFLSILEVEAMMYLTRLANARDCVPPGTFHGEDVVPPGTFHGEDVVPPGTFH